MSRQIRFKRHFLCNHISLGWIAMILSLPLMSHGIQSGANHQSTSITKRDLAEHGLSLLLPQDAAYSEELNKLQLNNKPVIDAVKPVSVIVRNTSQHALVALGIRWKISDPTGFLRTRDVIHLQPRGLLDGGRPRTEQASIPAGASRLVTLEGLVLSLEALKDFNSAFLAPGYSPASVQLDFAAFDNGEVVGPDEIGLLATFQVTVNAKQDLMEEVSAKVLQGQTLHEVLEALQSAAPKAPEPHAPLDPAGTYAALRQQYLDELIATERNFGEQTAMQSLQHHKYNVRPDIHRRKDNSK